MQKSRVMAAPCDELLRLEVRPVISMGPVGITPYGTADYSTSLTPD